MHEYFSGLNVSGDALFELISNLPNPAHVKDVKQGTYLFSNQSNLGIYGLKKIDDIIGATIHDLDKFMRPFWGAAFADWIDTSDDFVRTKNAATKNAGKIFLDKHGLLHVQDMIKTPVAGNHGQVMAIFTASFDLTNRLNLFQLLNLYKKAYPKKAAALRLFSMHVNIAHCFYEPLTEKELLCLLHLAGSRNNRKVVEQMFITPKTLETHLSHINDKSKGLKYSDILLLLNKATFRHGKFGLQEIS